MRDRITAWLAHMSMWVVYLSARRPAVPPPDGRSWTVTRGKDMKTSLLFIPAKFGEWHVAYLVDYGGTLLLVDGAVGSSWVHPLTREEYEGAFVTLEPEYVVHVYSRTNRLMYHSSVGPVTCIVLAKRLIGVHNPGMVTARQLLAYLWRNRDGSSSGNSTRRSVSGNRRDGGPQPKEGSEAPTTGG